MHPDDPEGDSKGALFAPVRDDRRITREYNALLDVLPDIVYKHDPEGRFVYPRRPSS